MRSARAERSSCSTTSGPIWQSAPFWSAAASRLTEAKDLIQDGLVIAREIQDKHLEAALLGDLGGVVANLGEYAEAERLLEGAQRLAEEARRPEQLARVCRQRGSVATTLGHYADAAAHYQRGLAIALDPRTEIREGRELASRLRAFLGELYMLNGDYSLAEQYLSLALKDAVALPSPEAECTALQHLGLLRMKTGSDEEASRYLADALRVAQRIFHRERTCFILGDLAYHLLLRGDFGGAIERSRESLSLAQELRHSRLMSYARWILGQSQLAGARLIVSAAVRLCGHLPGLGLFSSGCRISTTIWTTTRKCGSVVTRIEPNCMALAAIQTSLVGIGVPARRNESRTTA